MADGTIVDTGTAERIIAAPQPLYTKKLMAAAFNLEAVETGAVRS